MRALFLKRKRSQTVQRSLEDKAHAYARASRAESTLRSYQASWGLFTKWCAVHDRQDRPASAETLALFLSDLADRYRPSTLNRIISGIAFAHRANGHPFDRRSFETVHAGIRRVRAIPPKRVAAITAEELRELVVALPETVQGVRDRALLMIGFAGALRRSELVGLDVLPRWQDATGIVEIESKGVRLQLLRSKTDQEGHGLVKGITRGRDPCPVEALEEWLAMSGIAEGAIFRPITKSGEIRQRRLTDRSVADIVKRAVRVAAIQRGSSVEQADERADKVSGHSLRAGFATSAARANISGENIARHVGWESSQMAVRYIREADVFGSNNPVRKVLG